MPKITITITIDDGKVTVDAPEDTTPKSDLEPFLMHTDDELEIEQRPMTTDEDPAAIIKANHERFVKQVADDMIEPAFVRNDIKESLENVLGGEAV